MPSEPDPNADTNSDAGAYTNANGYCYRNSDPGAYANANTDPDLRPNPGRDGQLVAPGRQWG
jgi:hypothetical protein